MLADIPNPGSDEALELGCTCPILDNGHGAGTAGGTLFWINESCPLHGKGNNLNSKGEIYHD